MNTLHSDNILYVLFFLLLRRSEIELAETQREKRDLKNSISNQ